MSVEVVRPQAPPTEVRAQGSPSGNILSIRFDRLTPTVVVSDSHSRNLAGATLPRQDLIEWCQAVLEMMKAVKP